MRNMNSLLVSKLCLGTVQFGLDYGIANEKGKVSREEVFEILKYAQSVGLGTLDTSMAYGDSEQIIGEYLEKSATPFEVISKILVDSASFDSKSIQLSLQKMLKRLRVKQLDGCLIHKFEDFKNSQVWDVLEAAKKEGLVRKIGFSLYQPEDLELLWKRNVIFDMIQVPFSILDRRFEKCFKLLKEKNIEIHVRSVFLQGLVFLNPCHLPSQLSQAAEPIRHLQEISKKQDLSISSICLNYAVSNPWIDKVVIGCDSLEHFKKNVDDLQLLDKVFQIQNELKDLAITDEDILLPFRWNL
jgi:aryl-alcohol dehydrogenase-like predicted oxidoreductase